MFTGSKQWNQVTGDPAKDLEEWKQAMLKKPGFLTPTQPRYLKVKSEVALKIQSENALIEPINKLCGIPVIIDDSIPTSIQYVY
ncbi:hypothetical protein D3C75_506420 [compost metagenome]